MSLLFYEGKGLACPKAEHTGGTAACAFPPVCAARPGRRAHSVRPGIPVKVKGLGSPNLRFIDKFNLILYL